MAQQKRQNVHKGGEIRRTRNEGIRVGFLYWNEQKLKKENGNEGENQFHKSPFATLP